MDGDPGRREAHRLDQIDRRLLAGLRANARTSINELAQHIAVSRATAYHRLRRLEDEGVILGYTTRVDPLRAGLGQSAYVLVRIAQRRWNEVQAAIRDVRGVVHVAFVAGEFDFIVLVRAVDVAQMRDVILVELQAVPGVHSTQTIFILDEAEGLAAEVGSPISDPA